AAPARAARRHPAARPLPAEQVHAAHRQAPRRGQPGDDATPPGIPLAGQRPRAGKRAGARRHPGDRPDAGGRARPPAREPVRPDPRPGQPAAPPAEGPARPEGAAAGPVAATAQPAPGRPLPSLEAVERDHIVTVLRHTNWVITGPRGAATVLGMNPSTLRSRIKKLGISRDPA